MPTLSFSGKKTTPPTLNRNKISIIYGKKKKINKIYQKCNREAHNVIRTKKDLYFFIESLILGAPKVSIGIRLSKISVKDLITEYVPASTCRTLVYSALPTLEVLGTVVSLLEPRVLSTIKT